MKALVTGASSGIGKALAHLLEEKGYQLTFACRSRPQGVEGEWIPCDLTVRRERQTLVEAIQRELPDLVVNAAGFGLYGPSLDRGSRDHADLLEVNIVALFELTHAAAKALVGAGKKGTILNVSSAIAYIPGFPGATTYAASKLCVNELSASLDREVRSKGVRVLTSCPGMVATQFQQRASGGAPITERPMKMMSPELAAQKIWRQIEKGRRLSIFDWRYAFLCRLAKLFPQALVRKLGGVRLR